MNADLIQILLATYNGEKYLSAQLESIITQSYQNWRILAHDDGSIDNSLCILKSFADRYPDKIELIIDSHATGGAKNNFKYLLSLSRAQYVAFCDQDDVWRENRLELGYNKIRELESEIGTNRPIIVCSDTTIVDQKLKTIAESGWAYQRVGPSFAESIGSLAVRNYLTGCTMLINRSAINVSEPIPSQAVMHDWWIGLCVLRAGGKIFPLDVSTVLYRQHNNNVMGASRFSFLNYLLRIKKLKSTVGEFASVYSMARHSGAVRSWLHFMQLKVIVFIKIVKFYAR